MGLWRESGRGTHATPPRATHPLTLVPHLFKSGPNHKSFLCRDLLQRKWWWCTPSATSLCRRWIPPPLLLYPKVHPLLSMHSTPCIPTILASFPAHDTTIRSRCWRLSCSGSSANKHDSVLVGNPWDEAQLHPLMLSQAMFATLLAQPSPSANFPITKLHNSSSSSLVTSSIRTGNQLSAPSPN